LSPTPFLASDIDNPLLPALFIVPLMLAVLGMLFLAIKRPAASASTPRRRRGLLFVGVSCIIVGGFLTFMFATTRGGAPPFLYLVAVLPLLIGLRILARWGRPDRS
jgi:predicted membrane channel-forming protein YqfA (hemolysin III family)